MESTRCLAPLCPVTPARHSLVGCAESDFWSMQRPIANASLQPDIAGGQRTLTQVQRSCCFFLLAIHRSSLHCSIALRCINNTPLLSLLIPSVCVALLPLRVFLARGSLIMIRRIQEEKRRRQEDKKKKEEKKNQLQSDAIISLIFLSTSVRITLMSRGVCKRLLSGASVTVAHCLIATGLSQNQN